MLSKEELKQKVASLAKGDKKALAEFIIEYTDPQHVTFDFVGQLLNTRALKQGDILAKKVRKGLRVFQHVPGTIPLKSEITVQERANYMWDTAQISVTANVKELESGELGTVDSIRTEMQAKMRDFYISKVFTALTTIWTEANTPDNFTDVGADVTKVALDDMIEVVIKATGGVRAIVGVRSALQPITEFAGWATYSSTNVLADSIAEELARTGWVGQYKGIPLVTVPLDRDPVTNTVLVPEYKVLVVGQNVGDFVTFGDTYTQEYTDMRLVPAQWNLTFVDEFAFLVDNAQGLGVIETN
jgi:hypothetical protein